MNQDRGGVFFDYCNGILQEIQKVKFIQIAQVVFPYGSTGPIYYLLI